jgi:transposase
MTCKECGGVTESEFCEWCETDNKKCYICQKEFNIVLHNNKGRYICSECEGDYSPVINSKS